MLIRIQFIENRFMVHWHHNILAIIQKESFDLFKMLCNRHLQRMADTVIIFNISKHQNQKWSKKSLTNNKCIDT